MKEIAKKTLLLSNNLKYNFEILEKYEAGIVLNGTEVKSCIRKNIIIDNSNIKIDNKEIFINDLYISQYEHGNINNHIPNRKRKLLMHKLEIIELDEKLKKEGTLSIVPKKIYLSKRGKIKLELIIIKKKNIADNREKIKKLEDKAKILKYKKYN